jgi:hypothetical protein
MVFSALLAEPLPTPACPHPRGYATADPHGRARARDAPTGSRLSARQRGPQATRPGTDHGTIKPSPRQNEPGSIPHSGHPELRHHNDYTSIDWLNSVTTTRLNNGTADTQGRMRVKIGVLQEALTGHFGDHHGYLLRMMCDRVDGLSAQIRQLDTRIEEALAPLAAQVARLDEIPGIGTRGAQEIIAEIGVDMDRFPTAGHLVSWAKFAPKARQSAGKTRSASTGKGNPWLGATIGEAAMGAARTKTFLASRYRRIAKRRGKRRALVAVGNSIPTIAYHLLSDPDVGFTELGADYHDRLAPQRRRRQLIRELERLSGKKVTLQEAA